MPITMADFEKLAAERPRGTSLPQILGVENIYWSANLTEYIYIFQDVIGKAAAVAPISLRDRFPA